VITVRPGDILRLPSALTGSRARNTPPPNFLGAAFLVHGEVFMATDIKPLRDQIADASRELKLARRDGSAEWISKAAAALDVLIDRIPRTAR
jgi:hypothetical protein